MTDAPVDPFETHLDARRPLQVLRGAWRAIDGDFYFLERRGQNRIVAG